MIILSSTDAIGFTTPIENTFRYGNLSEDMTFQWNYDTNGAGHNFFACGYLGNSGTNPRWIIRDFPSGKNHPGGRFITEQFTSKAEKVDTVGQIIAFKLKHLTYADLGNLGCMMVMTKTGLPYSSKHYTTKIYGEFAYMHMFWFFLFVRRIPHNIILN